jgi:class I fructose-bisphosphate aldolase
VSKVVEILGDEGKDLLEHKCTTISKDQLHLPGPDFVDRVFAASDRPNNVLRNFHAFFNHGRLSGTGYLSILPVDQGIEHSGGASFAPNPIYFDPENIIKLAIEGGCNGVASTLGVMGSVARKYAHKIPFVLKINHNELLTYPNTYDQRLFASVQQAFDMGAVAVGATIRKYDDATIQFAKAYKYGLGGRTVAQKIMTNYKRADESFKRSPEGVESISEISDNFESKE